MTSNAEFNARVADVLAELATLYNSGEILGLAVSVVKRDCDLRMFTYHDNEGRFPLLAATDILHTQMMDNCRAASGPSPEIPKGGKA